MCLTTQNIIGFPVTCLSFNEQMETILKWAHDRLTKVVCVCNVHMLVEAHWHSELGGVLERADLVTPDGMPIVWMIRQLGFKQQNRVAGLDILFAVCHLSQQQDVSVFFLGSEASILDQMRTKLEEEFPNLKIAGMEPLPFRPLTEEEDEAVIQTINESGAGVVFLSLGCPKQEYWMDQHKGKISAVMIGLGGAFPVYAGIHKRAPGWVREAGLEWLYRFIQEPKRLWRRYYSTIPPFIWLAFKQLFLTYISKARTSSKTHGSTSKSGVTHG